MCGGLLLWKTLGLLIKKSLIRAIQERLKIREVVLAHGPVDSIEPDYLAVLPYWMGKRVPAILRFSVEDIQNVLVEKTVDCLMIFGFKSDRF